MCLRVHYNSDFMIRSNQSGQIEVGLDFSSASGLKFNFSNLMGTCYLPTPACHGKRLLFLFLILIFSFPSSFLVKAIISFLVKGFSSKWRLIFHPFADGAISAAFESGSVFYFQDLGGSKDLWVRFGYGHERLLDAAVPISQPAMTTAWPPFPSHHQLMLSGRFLHS